MRLFWNELFYVTSNLVLIPAGNGRISEKVLVADAVLPATQPSFDHLTILLFEYHGGLKLAKWLSHYCLRA